MNKKIILFLVIIVSVLSIMAISVWGSLPESNSRPSVQSITINNYDLMNTDGDKIKSVKDEITEDNYIYIFDYSLTPFGADAAIKVSTNQEGITASIDEMSQKVYVIFDYEAIGTTVTVTLIDQSTQITDEITLMFLPPSEIIIDDPNIF